MPGRKQRTVQQERAIAELVFEGYGAAQIYRELEARGLFAYPNPILSQKTIQRMVVEMRPKDPSGAWTLAEAEEPEEARRVLDVALYVFSKTQGRLWLSKDLARRVAHIRAASPDIPPDWAYAFALGYQALDPNDDGRLLDLLLASAPWSVNAGTVSPAAKTKMPSPQEIFDIWESIYGRIPDLGVGLLSEFDPSRTDETGRPMTLSWHVSLPDEFYDDEYARIMDEITRDTEGDT